MNKQIENEVADVAPQFFLLTDKSFRSCLERHGIGLHADEEGGAGSCSNDNTSANPPSNTLVGRYPLRVDTTTHEAATHDATEFFVELFRRTGDSHSLDQRPELKEYMSPTARLVMLKERCDRCDDEYCTPAQSATCILVSDEHVGLMQIIDGLVDVSAVAQDLDGTPPTRTAPVRADGGMTLTLKGFRRYLRLAADAAYTDGFELAATEAAELMKEMTVAGRAVAPDAHLGVGQLHYMSEYVKAYFREGQVLGYAIDFAPLRTEARNALKKIDGVPTDPETVKSIDDVLTKWFPDVEGERGDVGFVSRGGTVKEQFSGVKAEIAVGTNSSFSIDGPTEEPIEIGNTLVRLLVEASFDAVHRLPAIDGATATRVTDGPNKHPVNDPDALHDRKSAFLSHDDFASVERWANTGEGVATHAVGSAIRGVSWLSLNNEAIAGLIETFVGVAVRKVVEKTAYCVYSCLGDQDAGVLTGVDRLRRAPLQYVAYPVSVRPEIEVDRSRRR